MVPGVSWSLGEVDRLCAVELIFVFARVANPFFEFEGHVQTPRMPFWSGEKVFWVFWFQSPW